MSLCCFANISSIFKLCPIEGVSGEAASERLLWSLNVGGRRERRTDGRRWQKAGGGHTGLRPSHRTQPSSCRHPRSTHFHPDALSPERVSPANISPKMKQRRISDQKSLESRWWWKTLPVNLLAVAALLHSLLDVSLLRYCFAYFPYCFAEKYLYT